MLIDRLSKELLLEDDDWELWGQRYLVREKLEKKDGRRVRVVTIIAIFDSTQQKYIFDDHFTYELEA
jgi:hypothetical protein